ncbi:MAG: hypothetical protein K2X03_22600 [Bryobacteraceae bacterium]|nr:hypothetical protein [Bryobacteraceae bacterium]
MTFVERAANALASPGYAGASLLGSSGHNAVGLLFGFLLASTLFYAVLVFIGWSVSEYLGTKNSRD